MFGAPQPLLQERVIPAFGVLEAVLLGQRDRPLRQALEHEVLDVAALHERQRRVQAVSREAGPDADSYLLHAAPP